MLIEIYNLTGKKIHTLVNENQNIGSYEYNFNAKQLGYSSGIYLLKIKYNDEIFSFKLVEL